MMAAGWTIVLDVGKTHSKATLWDEIGLCRAQRVHTNQQLTSGSSLTLDVSGIEKWLQAALSEFAKIGPVRAIVPVAHGAGVALLRRGALQFAPLDYEWQGVAANRATYDKQRDSFKLSGSPALPAGLNFGIQLHWLEGLKSAEFRTCTIVPWAQYWAWVLSRVAVSEVTSLGCHSDLWRPHERAHSALAIARGWAERLAPLTPAGQILGTLEQDWVARTGLSPQVEVYCGVHDSNAAFLDARNHGSLMGHDCTVLSTGTWFVALRSPLHPDLCVAESLSEHRDCLVNVDTAGSPVPSARFMGGREIELLAGNLATPDLPELRNSEQRALVEAIECNEMTLPGGVSGVGPYPNAKRGTLSPREHPLAHAHLYAALLADVSLDLIGSRDTVLIEGRFSAAPLFTRTLATLRPGTQVLVSNDENGVARGALRIAKVACPESPALSVAEPLAVDITRYRDAWRDAAERAA
jgi:sugar (pentulose or hexulose) kinase